MRINTNIMALNAQHKLNLNQSSVEKSIQKLSSGLKINGASDDASGLAISEKMRAQIRGLSQAQQNAQDGISLLQTAEGALQQTTDILQRMRELVIKAQNTGVLTAEDKTSISNELSTLRDEIDRIAESTTFNGKHIINGEADGTVKISNSINSSRVNVDEEKLNANTTYKVFENNSRIYCTYQEEGGELKEESYEIAASDSVEYSFFDGTIIADGEYANWFIGTNPVTIKTIANEDLEFKIGSNAYTQDMINISIGDMSSKGLNSIYSKKYNRYWYGANYDTEYLNDGPGTEIDTLKEREKFSIDIDTKNETDNTLKIIDDAIEIVSNQRSTLGTVQNRMEYAINNLSVTEENLTSAESRIRDVDMAKEIVSYTKSSILNQSAMAMLAQANSQPESILTLLK